MLREICNVVKVVLDVFFERIGGLFRLRAVEKFRLALRLPDIDAELHADLRRDRAVRRAGELRVRLCLVNFEGGVVKRAVGGLDCNEARFVFSAQQGKLRRLLFREPADEAVARKGARAAQPRHVLAVDLRALQRRDRNLQPLRLEHVVDLIVLVLAGAAGEFFAGRQKIADAVGDDRSGQALCEQDVPPAAAARDDDVHGRAQLVVAQRQVEQLPDAAAGKAFADHYELAVAKIEFLRGDAHELPDGFKHGVALGLHDV